MRRVAALIALFVLVPASAVLADVDVGRGKGNSGFVMNDRQPGEVVEAPPAAVEPVRSGGGGRVMSRPAVTWYRFEVVLWDSASQSFCVQTRWTKDQAYAERQGRVEFPERFDTAEGGRVRPNCPATARVARTPAPPTGGDTTTPPAAQIAADVWQHVEDLPRPTLTVQPDGAAITGKEVYLQIHGPQTWSRTIDNPIGDDVVITASSDYVIDWGDPTDDASHHETTTSQGGPYPDGDVTHVYVEKAEHVTITVTQRWTATWQAGDRTGTLSQLTTTAEPPLTIEVRDLQAVRQR
jgi:hypothetical protein